MIQRAIIIIVILQMICDDHWARISSFADVGDPNFSSADVEDVHDSDNVESTQENSANAETVYMAYSLYQFQATLPANFEFFENM